MNIITIETNKGHKVFVQQRPGDRWGYWALAANPDEYVRYMWRGAVYQGAAPDALVISIVDPAELPVVANIGGTFMSVARASLYVVSDKKIRMTIEDFSTETLLKELRRRCK